MYRIMGCIILANIGLAIPPGAELTQHGQAMQQSIIGFIGHAQQTGQLMHGIMHGSMHSMGHAMHLSMQEVGMITVLIQ